MIRSRYVFIISIVMLTACGNKPQMPEKQIDPEAYHKQLEGANKYYTQGENDQIDALISRNAWTMTTTGTGLRYMIYRPGSGKKVADKTIVRYHYQVHLINGVLCDDSKRSGPKEIWIGHADVVSGLEEGMLLLREGDHAKFIIPSYLAYGWIGDSKTIPAKAVLIYDVEILQVRNHLDD